MSHAFPLPLRALIPLRRRARGGWVLLLAIGLGQAAAQPASPTREPLTWTAQQDHQDMMRQLGITRLRPGPSGREGATNSANYDPAKANPFPQLPEVLTLADG
ncbi:MAG: hypothetical protein IT580_13180, partial [Verrucomicrobiales bacterium]|nr:hypothetical protein [Verrucomicrobiales bacterium]